MRYLGEVNKNFQDNANLIHIKILLEKEAILRAAKHIFNEQIRESSNLYLSSVISHLLNMLLAPAPQLDLMNEGKINFEDHTLQSKLVPQQKKEEIVVVEDENLQGN